MTGSPAGNPPTYPWLAHYDPGVPHSLAPYPHRTLLDFVTDSVRERPQHPAFLFKGRPFTLAELERTSNAFAAALASLGVKRGDRVAAMLPNCPQFFIAEFATWKLGAVFAPLNPIYTEDELAGPLTTIDASIAVTLSSFYERLKKVQPLTPVKRIVTTNIKEWFPPLLKFAFTLFMEGKGGYRVSHRDGDLAMPELLAKFDGKKSTEAPPAPEDTAILLMSGGTTGTPKCVVGEHQSLVMSGLQLQAWLGDAIEPWKSVYMMPLPLFHSYGACAVQSICFIGHNPISLIPNPRDLNDIVSSIAKVKPAAFAGVPTLYNGLLNHPRVKSGKVSFKSLKVCASGAAALLAETKTRFEDHRRVRPHGIADRGVREPRERRSQDRIGGDAGVRRVRADRRRRRSHEVGRHQERGRDAAARPADHERLLAQPEGIVRDDLHRCRRCRVAAHRRSRIPG